MSPSQILATQQLPGQKKNKACITAHLCCNSTDTEWLSFWFIDMTERSLAFHNQHVNMNAMNMKWRNNATVWMNNVIIKKWLWWFDRQMSDKNVVLFMNNFSTHELTVENIEKAENLQNIRIIWLSNNSTSLHQSLNQEIIKNIKIYYHKYWLKYVLDEAEQKRNSLKIMNVLKTVQFFCKIWWLNVKSEIIVNCWKKSEVTGSIHESLSQSVDYENSISAAEFESQFQSEKKIEQLFTHLVQTDILKEDCLSIFNFIDSSDKIVFDSQNDVLEHITTQFDEKRMTESDEKLEQQQSKRIIKEVMNALAILCEHEKQTDDESRNWIASLNRQKRVLQSRRSRALRQQSIQSYL